MATAMIAQSVVSILADPDEEDCTNHMSLNQAREAWKNGQKVE